ncbi:MAG TPA: hypothetical protein VH592_14510 [Gemmataceae bacterium]|jgi:hypothetical protein
MHKKYADQGLVAVSLSLDNPSDAKTRAQVDAFLKRNEATMINLMVEGDPDDWYTKFNVGGLPLVFVFDRENRRVKKLVGGDQVDYKTIEAEVAKMLKK